MFGQGSHLHRKANEKSGRNRKCSMVVIFERFVVVRRELERKTYQSCFGSHFVLE